MDGGETLKGAWGDDHVALDRNLCWDASGRQPLFLGAALAEWQKRGHDRRSRIADPMFLDPARGNFDFRPGSPAGEIGFRAVDWSELGPRRRLARQGR